jgi:hypothetical protein
VAVAALIAGIVYVGDSETVATIHCRVIHGLLHSVSNRQIDAAQTSNGRLECCSGYETKSMRQPTIRFASREIVSPASSAEQPFCVYGEEFGSKHGASGISVGGVSLSGYTKWVDPGPPYGGQHLAAACGTLSRWTPAGRTKIVLTTGAGVSNALEIKVENDFSGLATTSLQPESSTGTALASRNLKGTSPIPSPR